jgi:hypothetical protein
LFNRQRPEFPAHARLATPSVSAEGFFDAPAATLPRSLRKSVMSFYENNWNGILLQGLWTLCRDGAVLQVMFFQRMQTSSRDIKLVRRVLEESHATNPPMVAGAVKQITRVPYLRVPNRAANRCGKPKSAQHWRTWCGGEWWSGNITRTAPSTLYSLRISRASLFPDTDGTRPAGPTGAILRGHKAMLVLPLRGTVAFCRMLG